MGQAAGCPARCAEDAGRTGPALDRRQGLDVGHVPAYQRPAHADGLRHHDGECRDGHFDRFQEGRQPYLPGAPYAQGEPYARHGAAEGQLRLCQRKYRTRQYPRRMVGGLRRCRRRSCQDGFRQPHRRRGGDGRGGTLRIRLWFDPCRERRRTDPSCGRAAGYDRSRRGVDRQRRENAARRPLQGQYREIRGRLPRQGGRTMPE